MKQQVVYNVCFEHELDKSFALELEIWSRWSAAIMRSQKKVYSSGLVVSYNIIEHLMYVVCVYTQNLCICFFNSEM